MEQSELTGTALKLTRRFSPFNLFILSINGMIGSAWLFAPLYTAKIAGSAALVSWLVGGIATVFIALTFAELSLLLPVAGGTAQIPQLSHGTFVSFIMSWIAWLSTLTMAPIEVQAVLQYASTYFTSLTHLAHGVVVLTGAGILWATVLMLGLCIINIGSFKGVMRSNLILFLFKIGVILLTIMMLIKNSFNSANFAGITGAAFSLGGWQAILTAVASGGVAFAFTGFKHGVELAGEVKKLAIAIPLAVVGSVVCCLILYMGLQIAFIGALKPDALQHGWQHLSFSGDFGPFVGLAAGLGLVWLVKFLYVDACASPLGAGFVYVMSTARILYAMSRMGYVPAFCARLNKDHLPIVAIFINFSVGMFLFLPFPGWQAMVSFLVSATVIAYAIGPIALLCLRLELPDEERQFRLPAAKVVCLLAFYFCNLLSYWTGWDTIYKLSIALLMGLALFGLAYWKGKLRDSVIGFKSVLWMLPYLLGLMLISYWGSFGGKGVIPFGWDFLVIALFSLVMIILAVYTRAINTLERYHLLDVPSF